jgi:hypothetical protein
MYVELLFISHYFATMVVQLNNSNGQSSPPPLATYLAITLGCIGISQFAVLMRFSCDDFYVGNALLETAMRAPIVATAAEAQKKHKHALPSYITNYTGPTTVWEEHPFPCHPGENDLHNNQPTRTGFLYTKPLKSASSTLAGIAIQAARNVARRQNNTNAPPCLVRWDHATPSAKKMQYDKRDESASYLWTFVREPTKRAISQYFFDEVSRSN